VSALPRDILRRASATTIVSFRQRPTAPHFRPTVEVVEYKELTAEFCYG
jgi:hypothetical protein